jgi:hypothetical protein
MARAAISSRILRAPRGRAPRHSTLLDIIGGYRFPGAPEVDLSAAIAPQIAAGQPVVDPWEIPDFLRRSLWPAVETVVEMKAAA